MSDFNEAINHGTNDFFENAKDSLHLPVESGNPVVDIVGNILVAGGVIAGWEGVKFLCGKGKEKIEAAKVANGAKEQPKVEEKKEEASQQ